MLSNSDLAMSIDLINQCLHIHTIDDLSNLHAILAQELGVGALIVGHINDKIDQSNTYGFGINKNWKELYIQENFALIDPVLKAALDAQNPISWEDAYNQASNKSKPFIDRANDFSLKTGISYGQLQHPVTSSSTIVSVSANESYFDQNHAIILKHLLPHISEILVRQSLWSKPHLTERELEVIKWSAIGKTYWELSVILSISERTVKFHMKNICNKLGVSNRTQAVARSLSLGLAKSN